MFDFLKRAIRATRQEGQVDAQEMQHQLLGLRLGGFVTIDALPFKMQAQQLAFTAPQGSQKIEAYGHIDLGASAELHRYYLSDDSWLQLSTTAGGIDDFKLWAFADTRHPANRAEFDRWLASGSDIGKPTLHFAGHDYQRVWGDAAAWAPPVCFEERVYTRSEESLEYSTVHHCMLYEREVAQAQRMEYVFVSAELSGEDYSVVYSIGVDLTQADLSVT